MAPVGRLSYCKALLFLISASLLILYLWLLISVTQRWESEGIPAASPVARNQGADDVLGPCAINLYGLPRNFKDFTLPTLIHNVIQPNVRYGCDWFVHYYNRTTEVLERGVDRGRGGALDPHEIRLLKDAVLTAHTDMLATDKKFESQLIQPPRIEFVCQSEEDFAVEFESLIHDVYTKRRPDGELVYIPAPELDYSNRTIENVLKMWNSQQAVWNLMNATTTNASLPYSRVAMLRSDVMYVTPIDIYRLPNGTLDLANEYAVIPDFANHPVNDRLIYGPYDAIEIWAAGRFERLEGHAEKIKEILPYYGIHSERFLYYTIFPAIRDRGVTILADRGICLLRVRSDDSIRASDCGVAAAASQVNLRSTESLIHRKCRLASTRDEVRILECREPRTVPDGASRNFHWKMPLLPRLSKE